MIVMAAETDYKNDYPTYRDKEKNLKKMVDDRVNSNAKKSYQKLKEKHIADHQKLFDRVSLDLGEQRTNIPTNQLVDNIEMELTLIIWKCLHSNMDAI